MIRLFRLYHNHKGVRLYDIADQYGRRTAFTYHHNDATIFSSANSYHDALFMEVTKKGTRHVEFTPRDHQQRRNQ